MKRKQLTSRIDPKNAAEAIARIDTDEIERYYRYLSSITPHSTEDIFRRWLFAFASVHTTWRNNCRLYLALKDLQWLGSRPLLLEAISSAKAGMQNGRTEFIHEFSDKYWVNPKQWLKRDYESWIDYRDRIRDSTKGIGRAKSSFIVEMLYPIKADVICTDTHVMQIYGKTPKQIGAGNVSDKAELAMEEHWVSTSRTRGIPPVLARWVFWDRKQGNSDPRYWSAVFEPDLDLQL